MSCPGWPAKQVQDIWGLWDHSATPGKEPVSYVMPAKLSSSLWAATPGDQARQVPHCSPKGDR